MGNEYDFRELCESGISINNLSEDAVIIFKEKQHKYILDPFRVVFEGDPEYKKGITISEALSLNEYKSDLKYSKNPETECL